MGHAGSKTRSRGHLVHFNNQRCQFSGLFLNSGFKPSRKTFDIDINQRIVLVILSILVTKCHLKHKLLTFGILFTKET